MKKIVGYKKNGPHYDPIYKEVEEPLGKTITQEEFLATIKSETNTFFESTSQYMGIGFDELSTKAYEKGAMMVYNILFPQT